MNWHDDKSNLDRLAVDAVNSKVVDKPLCCENSEVHIYAHRHSNGKGSAWAWCSSCGAYSHFTFPISQNWINSDKVEIEKLTAVPDYLETIKNVVDGHMNEYLKG